MSVTHIQGDEGQSSAQTGPVPEQSEADQALDRRLEQMLEGEMAKGLLASFHEDFDRLMQRLETGIRTEQEAMDKLLRRLRAS